VPRRYGFPTLTNDLQVIGPIARSVNDLRLAFSAIAAPVSGMAVPVVLRIGVVAAYPGAPLEPAVANAFAKACTVLRGLGHRLEDIACPWNAEEAAEIFSALAAGGAARALSPFPNWQVACMPNVAATVQAGLARSAVEHVQTIDALTAFRWKVADALAGFDIIATPASPSLAWPKREPFPALIDGQVATGKNASVFSTAINCAGLAALVLPMPVTPGALPAGLQLVAARMPEEALLDLGEAFEAASPWPRLAPM
jgi:aspartyl-tRNA(Asn)/glutamyl-tRNA(Gln) amidotransferase subunit A